MPTGNRAEHGVRRVAIERRDGPVVDALPAARFGAVAVSSRSVKALRGDSWRANAWAERRCPRLRAGGKRHPRAERILDRSRAHIFWRCWQDRVPYDPARHGNLGRLQTAGG